MIKILLLVILYNISFFCNAKILQPPFLDSNDKQAFQRWEEYYFKSKFDLFNIAGNKEPYLNELIESHSPYLQQHADNPINWKPWSQALLNKATRENKLIFLSIGYSTCHWCHVMRKESFSQLSVAEVINSSFYAIKVDREELPHIDAYYIKILEQVKENAGWPITAVITGKGKPIFIDSYLSKNKLIKLLTRIDGLWRDKPAFLLSASNKIDALIKQELHSPSEKALTINFVKTNLDLLAQLDPIYGGLKGKVKFPAEAMLLYALDQIKRSAQPQLEKLIRLQLDQMVEGGLYDHVGGGFHRYAIDPYWQVPHFEKMLYNQAQLILVYAQAYELFNDPRYLAVVKSTVEAMIRDFYKPNKGFISALDADYFGQEGKYYLWSKKEIISHSKGSDFIQTYPVNNTNNRGLVFKWQQQPLAVKESNVIRGNFLSARNLRPALYFDRKILTAWNALAIKALLVASSKLDNENYMIIAKNLINKIWSERYQQDSGRLSRTDYSSSASMTLHLSDYAFLADAFVDLYDIDRKQQWLDNATILSNQAVVLFQNDQNEFTNISKAEGMFSLSNATDGERLSAWATINQVLFRLQTRTQASGARGIMFSENKRRLDALIKAIARFPLNSLYASKVIASEHYGSQKDIRYFAKGHGKMKFNCIKKVEEICAELKIDIFLDAGWHVNSNQPLQEYLIATKIDVVPGVKVKFPISKQVKLGFQTQLLSVYEGMFTIKLMKAKTFKKRLYLELPLQACNDELCLLPQSFNFYF